MTVGRITHNNRIEYLDFMRVFSTFCVIVLHVAVQNWHNVEIGGYNWLIFTLYDSTTRWTVPVFLMISGALLINRYMTIDVLYNTYIKKLLVVFIVWSTIYSLIYSHSFKEFIINFTHGHYHLWYLPLLIGLYMTLPILGSLNDSEFLIKYIIKIGSILSIIIPQILRFLQDFGGEYIKQVAAGINETINKTGLFGLFGYATYFILGYYLHNKQIEQKDRKIIYILGIIGFISTFILTNIMSIRTNLPNESYFNNLTINVALMSIAIFVWFKYNYKKLDILSGIIPSISRKCLGVYLIHVLVIDRLFYMLGLNTMVFNTAISVPIISISTMLLSLVLIKLYNLIIDKIKDTKNNIIKLYNKYM